MNVIGISGFARAGKDTFASIAKNILTANGYRVKQYSFANVLKKEVEPFLKEICGCDVWTQDSEVKSDMRDFLVWYGTTWWRKRDPKRWIRYVDLAMKEDKDQVDIAIVTDVRYPNEGEWIHSWSGYLVHVAAWKWEDHRDGYGDTFPCKTFFKAPNKQEEINDPIVTKMSDYCLEWQAKGLSPEEAADNPELQTEVLKALNSCDWFNLHVKLLQWPDHPSKT